MFSKQLRRHGHEHGHGHRMHRHGGRHDIHGDSFRFPGHHMGHDSFRRRHHHGMRGFDFGQCCSSENESPDETTQNVQGEKTVCERRHRWRHGRCCGDKIVSESAEDKSDSAMDEGNVEPKDNNNTTNPVNPEAPTLEKTGGRFYCKHRIYLARHLKDVMGNKKRVTIAEGEKEIMEEEDMRHHRGHHAGKRSRHHGRRCHSGESSSENESGRDQRAKHGHIRRHHHHHHGGKRGHRDCWKTFYGARSDGESTDHEHTTDTEGGGRRMFRGRHGGKFHGHHHRGWKGLRCYIIMVDSATNTEDLEVPTSNQNESHPSANPEVPSLVELIELGTGTSQETSQEEATSASDGADQVSEVADNLRKSSLE